MALVVEDGTGLSEADSYISVEYFDAYATSRGLTVPEGAEPTAKESALRRATTWIDAAYGSEFSGVRLRGREQALQWPRRGARDAEGDVISSEEVPVEIERAAAEAAMRELGSPGSLSPDVTTGRVEKSVSVSGAVSVEYAVGRDVVDSQRPILTIIDDILRSLTGGRRRSAHAGFKFLGRA